MKSFANCLKPSVNTVNPQSRQTDDPTRRQILRGAFAAGCGLLLPAVLLGCDKKTETGVNGSVPRSPGDTSGADMAPPSNMAPEPTAPMSEAPTTESSAPADSAKASQPSVQYQDQPKGEQKCSGCMHFAAPDACKVVAGPISPEGWCVMWAAPT